MPQANTIANDLNVRLESLFGSGLQYASEIDSLISLEREAKKLSKVNMADGYLVLAAVSMLKGNFDEMRRRYGIANNQGLSAGQRINFAVTLAHAGFFSEAAAIAKGSVRNFADPYWAFLKAALCFQFQLAIEIYDKAVSQNSTPSKDTVGMRNVLDRVVNVPGLDGAALAQLADLAGEVMREHHMYFKTFPLLKFCSDEGGGEFVVASFSVPVSFEDASEMTLSFAEKMFTQELSNEKFLIRFSGEA